MKSIYVSQLSAGDEVINEPFLLHDVGRRKTRDGRPYLLLILRDKSGQINGVFWDVPQYVDDWAKTGALGLLSGRITRYKDALQINVTDLNPAGDLQLADFMPASTRSTQEMIAELEDRIAELSEPWRGLLQQILLDDSFINKFAGAPAARNMHHAYIGGLIEHSLSMATLASMLAAHYPYVDRDLLISGTLLHDIGKTREYEMQGSFEVTADGRLVGHIVRGITMVERAAEETGFPQQKLQDLVHLIASHHGKLEWGSPVVPKTLEAVLLHQIDLLDSRVQGFLDHLSNEGADDEWTRKSSLMFGAELRRPSAMATESNASDDRVSAN